LQWPEKPAFNKGTSPFAGYRTCVVKFFCGCVVAAMGMLAH
jgi:hypothetical protein